MISIDLEFTIQSCAKRLSRDKQCKETFNLFYYEATDDTVASSTFPLWLPQDPYKKIATVAAKDYGRRNLETFPFGQIPS